jgi:hypothetical protein
MTQAMIHKAVTSHIVPLRRCLVIICHLFVLRRIQSFIPGLPPMNDESPLAPRIPAEVYTVYSPFVQETGIQ